MAGQAAGQGLGRVQFATGGQEVAGGAAAQAQGQASCAEHDAELRARKPEGDPRQGHTLLAGDEQIGARTPGAALGHGHGALGGLPDRGQQRFDAHQAPQQRRVAGLVHIREVQAGAEVPPLPAQHQGVDRVVLQGGVHTFQQGFHQFRRQRVPALRPIHREREHAVAACAEQSQAGVRGHRVALVGQRLTEPAGRAAPAGGCCGALDRSQRLGTVALS